MARANPVGRVLLACAFGALLPSVATAQSTDGYHAIQVFPVVVDSTSFRQRFNFRGTQLGPTTVAPRYYPAEGTSQAGALDCPTFSIPWGGRSFASLRALCPELAEGAQFGMLVLTDVGPENRPFAGFSRASNAAGAGFSIEAFPAHTFTGAFSTVAGLRRLSATAQSPAFQSNCFVGMLPEANPPASPAARVVYGLLDAQGQDLGAQTAWLVPGQMRRLLDVFGALGAPAGDFEDVTFVVRPAPLTTPAEAIQVPPLVAFCTVQKNTAFSADFRIAKQDFGTRPGDSPAAQDMHVLRDAVADSSLSGSNHEYPALLSIEGSSSDQQALVFFFRQPDWVSCRLEDLYQQPLDAEDGLEMRLMQRRSPSNSEFSVVAGGDGVTGFGKTYLGDKRQTYDGANSLYIVQVENNESAPRAPGNRYYTVHCKSGSGHAYGGFARTRPGGDEF